jgi:hypothetical protein
LLVIGYGAKICWVAMRVKAENRMVTTIIWYYENKSGNINDLHRQLI